ncbi:hypothetical protein IWX78_000730 [Mycetocola sp. CAN_C7]
MGHDGGMSHLITPAQLVAAGFFITVDLLLLGG